jgi:hypothetical protein
MIKLIDVHPDGKAYPMAEGILRARFRDGLDKPAPLTPGQAYRYSIDMVGTALVFQPGHRIRVDVTSSTSHCGRCGDPCGTGQLCSGGTCVDDCSGGLSECAGTCVDRERDENHGGMGDRQCGADRAPRLRVAIALHRIHRCAVAEEDGRHGARWMHGRSLARSGGHRAKGTVSAAGRVLPARMS